MPSLRQFNPSPSTLRSGIPTLRENEKATTLKMVLEAKPFQTISLLTGPEGGLEQREVELAQQSGFHICTLGSRILRCETAPLCALSAVMYAVGEF